MFRRFRILLLLLVLLVVAVGAWRAKVRVTSWETPIVAAVYPIAADATPETAAFIQNLKPGEFAAIEQWLKAETERYGHRLHAPLRILLAPQVKVLPPRTPQEGGVLKAILWSLEMRWWAFRHDDLGAGHTIRNPHLRLFLLYHAATPGKVLPHSTGLKEGQIGLVHVFAAPEQTAQNAVVVAHELLHTLGATDKYDLRTLQPLYPEGYAEPERQPPLPQHLAEIMAGRIPLRPDQAEMPGSLDATRIGRATAIEIGLLKVGGR
jgi:hypothetical protein